MMSTRLTREEYLDLDGDAIGCYNSRWRSDDPRILQTFMHAAPYDGDPFKAKVILLMNNPGYYEGSIPEDHTQKYDGWPLAGLHYSARQGFRNWYSRPFGRLINIFGDHEVSNSVAILQITPWASTMFDPGLILPSRGVQFKIAQEALGRGVILVIGRSARIWRPAFGRIERNIPNVFTAKNPRNPTLSPGGIGEEAFEAIVTAIGREKLMF